MALANVALTDTFDVWRVRTNQIIVSLSQVETSTNSSFVAANAVGVIATSAFDKANSTLFSSNVYITTSDSTNAALTITQTGTGPALVVGNTADPNSSLIIIDSNNRVGIGTNVPTSNLHVVGTANITDYLVVAGMNVTFTISSAFSKANDSSTIASAAFGQANDSLTVAISSYDFANTINITSVAAFSKANDAFSKANDAFTLANDAFTLANTSGGATIFGINVGNSSANTFNVAHNLNKFYTIVNVRENATGYHVYPDIRYTSPDTIEVQFVDPPSEDQYLVMVLGG